VGLKEQMGKEVQQSLQMNSICRNNTVLKNAFNRNYIAALFKSCLSSSI